MGGNEWSAETNGAMVEMAGRSVETNCGREWTVSRDKMWEGMDGQ